jgi:Tol biopolymer transport system component
MAYEEGTHDMASPEADRNACDGVKEEIMRWLVWFGGLWVMLLMGQVVNQEVVNSATGVNDSELRRVTVGWDGSEANDESYTTAVSRDGRTVAFSSFASNLIEVDGNFTEDVFVQSLDTGVIERVSVSNNPDWVSNGRSQKPILSPDGRLVLYTSAASNLVTYDPEYHNDVFLYNRDTGVTILISKSRTGFTGDAGSEAIGLSDDGRFVFFASHARNLVEGGSNGRRHLYVRDVHYNITTRLVTALDGGYPNQDISGGDMSADGRYIVFSSNATNLIPNDTNEREDVFVLDRLAGTVVRVNQGVGGAEANDYAVNPRISADGSVIVYHSSATNLLDEAYTVPEVFTYQRATGLTGRVSYTVNGELASGGAVNPVISADGRYVAFLSYANNLVSGDNNAAGDIYRRDLVAGVTDYISVSNSGIPANRLADGAVISGDGQVVVFKSEADNLAPNDHLGFIDIFVRAPAEILPPLPTATPTVPPTITPSPTPRVNPYPHEVALPIMQRAITNNGEFQILNVTLGANGDSAYPSASYDGAVVALETEADNLVANDGNGVSDIVVWHRWTGQYVLVSRAMEGGSGNGASRGARIAAQGRYVVFTSEADNLVPNDTNGYADVFRHDLWTGTTTLVSQGVNGTPANAGSHSPAISADGRWIAFISDASNMATEMDCCGGVFVRDMETGELWAIRGSVFASNVSMSADGQRVLYQRSTYIFCCEFPSIYSADAPAWQERLLYQAEASPQYLRFWVHPMLSPDGSKYGFYYIRNTYSPYGGSIRRGTAVRSITDETEPERRLWEYLSFYTNGVIGGAGEMSNVHDVSFSDTGRMIAFMAEDLRGDEHTPTITSDTNGWHDIYLVRGTSPTYIRISIADTNHQTQQANGDSTQPWVAGDGNTVFFRSEASNLVGDTNGVADIFMVWYPPYFP